MGGKGGRGRGSALDEYLTWFGSEENVNGWGETFMLRYKQLCRIIS